MGYHMYLREASFKILACDQKAALTAIKGLAGKETIRLGSEPHFSWIETKEFLKARHLEVAMEAWRWEVIFDDTDDIVDIEFTGEKLGDDAILFAAIAPFVVDGSYIQMSGEDNYNWRWVFKDGAVKEVPGKLLFEEGAV